MGGAWYLCMSAQFHVDRGVETKHAWFHAYTHTRFLFIALFLRVQQFLRFNVHRGAPDVLSGYCVENNLKKLPNPGRNLFSCRVCRSN